MAFIEEAVRSWRDSWCFDRWLTGTGEWASILGYVLCIKNAAIAAHIDQYISDICSRGLVTIPYILIHKTIVSTRKRFTQSTRCKQ